MQEENDATCGCDEQGKDEKTTMADELCQIVLALERSTNERELEHLANALERANAIRPNNA